MFSAPYYNAYTNPLLIISRGLVPQGPQTRMVTASGVLEGLDLLLLCPTTDPKINRKLPTMIKYVQKLLKRNRTSGFTISNIMKNTCRSCFYHSRSLNTNKMSSFSRNTKQKTNAKITTKKNIKNT